MNEQDMMLIGLGGGGGRILDAVVDHIDGNPVIAAIDTDKRALDASRATTKVPVGARQTQGLGTGGEPYTGDSAVNEDLELLRVLLADKKVAILVTALGGGTGTGGAPVVLKAARDAGALTLCFATLPFAFEGKQRTTDARRAVPLLRDACDALIVVPNDRLFGRPSGEGLAETFARADATLGQGVFSIWQMLFRPGYIRLDFASLRRAAHTGKGVATLAVGEGSGPDKAAAAVRALLEGPLLDGGRVLGIARSVLVSLVGGADLTLQEVGAIMEAVSGRAPREIEVFMGTAIDPDWVGRVTVTAVVSLPPGYLTGDGAAAPAPVPVVAESAPATAPAEAPAPAVARPVQGHLDLEAGNRGRFKDTEPNLVDGQDVDTPTFIRRGIPVER